jgi:hypothetical protein
VTFYQSRAISKTGLHVRRAAWSADKWLMIWRGTWFCFASGNPAHPVRATDYSTADLLATDWTTMPAALAACPIDPTIGSTGGASAVPGSPGSPGSPGFPDDATPLIVSLPGSGAPSGPGAPTVLPPPAPGSGYVVVFSGITFKPWPGGPPNAVYENVNGTYPLVASGVNHWTAAFPSGHDDGGPFIWVADVTRNFGGWDDSNPLSKAFSVTLKANNDDFKIAFDMYGHAIGNGPQPLGMAIENARDTGDTGYGYGGTATIQRA